MEDIKVGDIVQPKTAFMRNRYGIGIVVEYYPFEASPGIVVFHSKTMTFTARGFKEPALLRVKVLPQFKVKVQQAGKAYTSMKNEMKIV